MLEQVHKHIISELQQNTRTDIIFIITAIFLNLLALGINAATAERSQEDTSLLIVIIGLLKGKQTRCKLIGGLLKMYKDQ
ncbi:unnamed protein product, partial [marine sediment metagenome]